MGNSGQIRILTCAAVLSLAGGMAAADTCSPEQVNLRGDWGQARFTIALADTGPERSQGLMHVKEMPTSSGMLFVYPDARNVSFWMKNTFIPLDLIFLDATGTVKRVHENAVPHDETPISGGSGDILAVLEINGGLAGQLGIVAGSEMRHPAFDPESAAWPCE